MPIFTIIFLTVLTATSLMRMWLAKRHIDHVISHRDQVPQDFSSQISLKAHQKAADYTCAKTRLGYASILLDVVLLLILTLGGGLNALHTAVSNWTSDPLMQGVALIASAMFLASVVSVPLSYYRTFVIEEQFGFNKMKPRMFFLDLAKRFTLGIVLGMPLLLAVLWL